jgi:signal transduction histidine kinase
MRLWVRLSLLISGLLVVVILATTTIAVIVYGQGGDRFRVETGQGQLDTPSVADISFRLGTLAAIVGLIGVTVGVIVSRTVSAPISQLAGAAHRIGEGDLGIRVKAGGSQELVELAHAFNKMVADLQHADELRANLIADVSHELRTPLAVL